MDPVEWQVNDDDYYELNNIIVKFDYKIDNQKASFGQNDIILIEGGYVDFMVEFLWFK